MTDDYFEEHVCDEDDSGNPVVRAMLRRDARAGAEARKEATALRRELALTRAGVPEDSPLGKLFRRTFDGTDAEVADAWAEVVPIGPVVPMEELPRDTVTDPVERAATTERANLAAGGSTHERGSWTPDPRDVALATGRKIVNDGGTSDDALAAHFDVLARAASQNDRRVRLK